MVKERDTPGARSPATITSESGVCARITPTVAQTRTAARAFRVIRDILPVVGASAMGFEFRPAKREDVGLLIGLSGGTGSGKTFTAMRLPKGLRAIASLRSATQRLDGRSTTPTSSCLTTAT